MKRLYAAFLVVSAAIAFSAEEVAKKATDETAFREPFTLKLHVDKEHFYEEEFGKIPFVHDNNVYLFKGDEFGLNFDTQTNSIRGVKYQSDLKKADVTLKFSQEAHADGNALMLLKIHNNTKHTLEIDALMTVPGKKSISKTSILPVEPGLSGYESWPHAIVQLVLRNIRIKK